MCSVSLGRRVLRQIVAILLIYGGIGIPVRAQQSIRLAIDRDEQHIAAIEQALESRLNVSYKDTPLQAALDAWRSQYQINIVVDHTCLADAGVGLDTPFTLEMNNVRFESLLDTIVDMLSLEYVVQADHLLITTPDAAAARNQIRMYPVQDLVLGIRGGRVMVDYDSIIQAITSSIATDQWEENGGYGSIVEVPAAGTLVISQSRRVHRQVEAFLASVREARDAQGIEVLPPNASPAPAEDNQQGLGRPAPGAEHQNSGQPQEGGGGLFRARD